MNDNPIYKYQPNEFFSGPELLIATAIRNDNLFDLKRIAKTYPHVNLNIIGKSGVTLLLWACAHRHPKAVEILLKLGADPNLIFNDGSSKSHLVAMTASGVSDEAFELLLAFDGDPNGRIDQTPAIFKTVYAQRYDRMKMLLDKGADINSIDGQSGESLVLFCTTLNQFEVVVYLIERGADFTLTDGDGSTLALEVQEMKGKLNEENEKWRAQVEQMLKDRGVKFPVLRPWEKWKRDK